MTGVADDQADVVLPGKVDTGLNVLFRLRIDHVDAIVSKAARIGRVVGWETLRVRSVSWQDKNSSLNHTEELEKYFHMIMASCSTLSLLVGLLDGSSSDYSLPLLVQDVGFDLLRQCKHLFHQLST